MVLKPLTIKNITTVLIFIRRSVGVLSSSDRRDDVTQPCFRREKEEKNVTAYVFVAKPCKCLCDLQVDLFELFV